MASSSPASGEKATLAAAATAAVPRLPAPARSMATQAAASPAANGNAPELISMRVVTGTSATAGQRAAPPRSRRITAAERPQISAAEAIATAATPTSDASG